MLYECFLCKYRCVPDKDVNIYVTDVRSGSFPASHWTFHHECFKHLSGITFKEFKDKYDNVPHKNYEKAITSKNQWDDFVES